MFALEGGRPAGGPPAGVGAATRVVRFLLANGEPAGGIPIGGAPPVGVLSGADGFFCCVLLSMDGGSPLGGPPAGVGAAARVIVLRRPSGIFADGVVPSEGTV